MTLQMTTNLGRVRDSEGTDVTCHEEVFSTVVECILRICSKRFEDLSKAPPTFLA